MDDSIKFKRNNKKVVEALVYLAKARPGIDVFHIAKVLFYADRDHFRSYGRPILGDTYKALDDGPVPSYALNVAKFETKYVPIEILAFAAKKLQIKKKLSNGKEYVCLTAIGDFDDEFFSRTDLACLDKSISTHADMNMIDLWRKVHSEPEYKAHYKGEKTSETIPYESFVPYDSKNRDDIIKQIAAYSYETQL